MFQNSTSCFFVQEKRTNVKSIAPGLILQNQNSDIHQKGAVVKGATNSILTATQKKGGGGLGNQKALQDISNSSSLHQEASTRKKSHTKNEFNIAEEMFLHDHNKCIEVRKAAMERHLFDTVLFEHDLLYPDISPKPEHTEADFASPPRYLKLEPVIELLMPALTDWSPSPIQWDSPPPSPSQYELPELVLKPYIDD